MSLSGAWLVALSGGVFLVTWAGTWAALPWLRRRGVMDIPNSRSSHAQPTPTGGGIVPVLALCATWATALWIPDLALDPAAMAIILTAALALSLVSWVDDLRGLSPSARLLAHFLAVGLGVLALPGPVFQGLLPLWADATVAAFLWVWFVNLFNFMDGIDGIACAEVIAAGMGIALVAVLAQIGAAPVLLGMTLAGAAAGFMLWNWQPAKIFLGDVGAVPLGFLLGWVLLALAAAGQWAAAVILPLVFVADASLTLLRRLMKREPVWQAHRGHFYQRAAVRLGGHGHVVAAVSLVNTGLVLIAVLVAVRPATTVGGIVSAVVLVIALLWYFHRAARTHGTQA